MAVFNNILNGASGQAGGAGAGYQIERSLRFEGNTTTPYLSKNDYAADSNRQTFTLSLWVKKSATVSNQRLFGLSGTNQFSVMFSGTDQLSFYANLSTGTAGFDSAAKYRDFSAWYHIVLAFDTTASGADKMKVYVNGEEPSFTSISQPADNATFYWGDSTLSHFIGRYSSGSSYFYNGYMADIHYVDGQQLNQYDFGEFDANGVWQPIEYTGTYGTNGFHLDFSDNTSTTTIAEDSSGNGNDWTANNITPFESRYANSTTTASSGTVSNGSEDPYWIDFDPVDADLDYDADAAGTFGMARVHDGNTANNEVYWVGNLNNNRGNVKRARFDLRDFPTITSLRVYGGFATTFVNYKYRLLDSSKTEISGTEGEFGAIGWHSVTILGSPRYLEISCLHTTSTDTRHRLYAIEVNGTVLVNGNPANTDSFFDSPTNGTQTDTGAGGEVSGNYSTFNSIHHVNSTGAYTTPTNGNLAVLHSATTGWASAFSTLAVNSGKWYVEYTLDGTGNTASIVTMIGMSSTPTTTPTSYIGSGYTSFSMRESGGTFAVGVTKNYTTGGGNTWVSGDVVMFAVDMDTGDAWFGANGTWYQSGDPANGTNPMFSGLLTAGPDWTFGVSSYRNNQIPLHANFGQRPYSYTAPSGFKAVCTANLDDPDILDGSTQMDSVLYTGDGTAGNTITGLNFAPDLVWLKVRATYSYNHELYDTVRGVGERLLSSGPNAEVYDANYLQQFNSDGFQLGSGSGQNTNNASYVSWTWKGGGTAVSNTNGSITSSVSANPSAGFSIVSYTGTGSNATVGHGLNAAPKFVVVKNRDTSADWSVWHSAYPATKFTELNTTVAATLASSFWNDTEPTSTTFSVGTHTTVNESTKAMIAYCWAPVEGYSAFGSYIGNSNADGPFVYTGFKPQFIIWKQIDVARSWLMFDNARNPYNVVTQILYPNLTQGESSLATVDFLSNGFKLRVSGNNYNLLNGEYMYAAFAEHPFKYARAR